VFAAVRSAYADDDFLYPELLTGAINLQGFKL
jgi:hypothetical protein